MRVVAKRLCVVVAELGPKQIPVVLAGFRNRFPRFRVLKLSATFCRLFFSKEANIGFSRLYTDLDSHVGHELPQLYPPGYILTLSAMLVMSSPSSILPVIY